MINVLLYNFIEKAKKAHGEKFDYSRVKYINNRTKISIICPIHGIFFQTPEKHIFTKGCKKCSFENLSITKTKSNKTFIINAINIHNNKYDYSKTLYIHCHKKIDIICPIHGIFSQSPSTHLKGQGCVKCGYDKLSISNSNNTEYFITKSNIHHGDKYNYSLVEYINNKTKVKILCPIHGEFSQKAADHLNGCGCPRCNSSKGEIKIEQFFKLHCIKIQRQKKFLECINPKTNYKLSFDFYLPDYNILIEYDGQQHFKPVTGIWSQTILEFNLLKIRDRIKNKFAKKNNIKLLRIKYTQIKNVDKILTKNLKINI